MRGLRAGGFVVGQRPTVAEQLGFGPDARLVIVNCDDLGSSAAANAAIYRALRSNAATSASLMVPCPAASAAVADYRGEDVGVHLTLNSEWDDVRWRPLTHAPALCEADGTLHRSPGSTVGASPEVVLTECRAQIHRALEWGVDVSHLDTHMHSLLSAEALSEVYVRLADEFALPLRLRGRPGAHRRFGITVSRRPGAARELAARLGVLAPDHLAFCPIPARPRIEQVLGGLRAGVTEIFLHPADDDAELRASHPDWEGRVEDAQLLEHELRGLVEGAGATTIGYRELRDLQRSLR